MSRNIGAGLGGKSFESQPGFLEALGRLDAFIKKIYSSGVGEGPGDRVLYYLQLKYGDKVKSKGLEKYLELEREGAIEMDKAILAPVLDWVKRVSFFQQKGITWTLPEVQALLYRLYEVLYPQVAEND